jgi:hypothetical protein
MVQLVVVDGRIRTNKVPATHVVPAVIQAPALARAPSWQLNGHKATPMPPVMEEQETEEDEDVTPAEQQNTSPSSLDPGLHCFSRRCEYATAARQAKAHHWYTHGSLH